MFRNLDSGCSMATLLTSPHDAVVLYPSRQNVPEHENHIHHDIAARLANLFGCAFDGVYDPARHATMRCYFVPTDTLLTPSLRSQLGVRDEFDLYGGYADYAFMPTKAITHALIGPEADRPPGWSDAFATQVQGATLPGRTVFTSEDILTAAEQLGLGTRTLRLKPVLATAGRGQQIINDRASLESALKRVNTQRLAECGLVLEVHLENVTTYSVGQLRLPGLTASYIGTQRLTHDNQGTEVYGGSRLLFARGGYETLATLPIDPAQRRAVEYATRYDQAADTCYAGFFASRRNYDVAAGTADDGEMLVGVLEQSWRIGGASRAEIAAAEAFAADPSCACIWAETREVFGDSEILPAHAMKTYEGDDPDLGRISKYVMVNAYDDKHQHH